jgi:hypothetical protein
VLGRFGMRGGRDDDDTLRIKKKRKVFLMGWRWISHSDIASSEIRRYEDYSRKICRSFLGSMWVIDGEDDNGGDNLVWVG